MLTGKERTNIKRINTLTYAIIKNRNWIKFRTVQKNMREIQDLCKELLS